MKKILLILLTLTGTTWAMTTLNLTQDKIICNGHVLNNNLTESAILSNCKSAKKMTKDDIAAGHNEDRVRGSGSDDIQDDDVQDLDTQYDIIRFNNDQSQTVKCYFKNTKLTKCKIKDQATSTSVESSTTK